MREYRDAHADFSIEALERRVLLGSRAAGLNACIECCDRWADNTNPALRWIAPDGRHGIVSFAQLQADAARFAGVLAARGVRPGDVVAGLLPRIPELLTVILGTWRLGAVYQPLFTAFGPAAIQSRISPTDGSSAKLIVTDSANRAKLDDVAPCPPVLLIARDGAAVTGDGDFYAELAAQPAEFAPVMRLGNDPFIMIFTSGTTGRAKAVSMPLEGLLQFATYMEDSIDLRPDDVFWNMADPGWAYGMYAAIAGPLLLGCTTTLYEGSFTVDSTLRVIAQHGVNNLIAAPTVYRMMMAAGDAAVQPIQGQLRAITSGGEPLNPEVIRWSERMLGCPIRDNYGQTEFGVAVCNHHGLRHPIKSGSCGQASPGFTFVVLDEAQRPVAPNQPGLLAIDRARSPLFMFTGYWHAETPSLTESWYLTGDTMRMDEDGYLFFVGRSDDIITSAGYRIGPFDVESALMEHPSVAECAVIGKPDPERTEIVRAFVVLRAGYDGSGQLASELQQLVRRRLSNHAYPREIMFVPVLPKTPSGKVQRFLLRQQA